MTDETLSPKVAKERANKRHALAPDAKATFRAFSKAGFQNDALPRKSNPWGGLAPRLQNN